MVENHRQTRRTRLDMQCWIVTAADQPRRECLLQDISETGARVALAPGAKLPNAVDLHLTNEGTVTRKSEVIWQTRSEAGLHFVGRAQKQRGAARQHDSNGLSR